jgi:hypothetical protein
MFAFALKIALFWALFPLATLKNGLSRWGYALDSDAGRVRRLFNLLCGVGMGFAALRYSKEVHGPRSFSEWGSDFMDTALSSEAFTAHLEAYGEFWGWFVERAFRAIERAVSIVDALLTHPVTILGIDLSLISATAYALLIPFAVFVLWTEARVMVARIHIRIHNRKYGRYGREIRRLSALIPEGADMDTHIDILDQCRVKRPQWPEYVSDVYGFISGNALGFDLRNHKWRVRLPMWMQHWDLFQYKIGDVFFYIDGIVTPAVSAPFLILLLGPILLTIGYWALAAFLLILGFLPFAFLHANGVRMRMH